MLDQHLTENLDCLAIEKKKLVRRLNVKSRLKKYQHIHQQHQQLLIKFKKYHPIDVRSRFYIMADKELSTSGELDNEQNNNGSEAVLTAINLALATAAAAVASTSSSSSSSSAASTSSSNEFGNFRNNNDNNSQRSMMSFTSNNNNNNNNNTKGAAAATTASNEIRQQPVEFDDDDDIDEHEPDESNEHDRDDLAVVQGENQESNDNYDDIDEAENERIRTTQLANASNQQQLSSMLLNNSDFIPESMTIVQEPAMTTTNATTNTTLIEDESGSSSGYQPSRYSRLTMRLRSYLNAASNTSNVQTPHESLISRFGLNVNLVSIRRYMSHRSSCTAAATAASAAAANETFEPRSGLFTKIHNDYKQIKTTNVKKNKLCELLKLANLYLNYESYYSLMLMPMSDNFKLSVVERAVDEAVESDATTSAGTTTMSSKMTIEPTSFKRMKHRRSNGSNEYMNSDDDDNDDDVVDENNDGEMKEPDNETSQNRLTASSNETSSSNGAEEFHLCALCSHALYEPVTLVCGCTYCKNCLNEYNQALKTIDERKRKLMGENSLDEATRAKTSKQAPPPTAIQSSESSASDQESTSTTTSTPVRSKKATTKRKHHSQTSLAMSYRCFSCSKTHEQNSTEYQKTNVIITKLVDKFWSTNVEMRKLRNDIRNFICFCMEKHQSPDYNFDLNKFEFMLNSAYTLDPSNHLILADLFILNYFNQCDQTCLKYAQMACDLKPNWTFGYYMKSIYYEQIGDTNNLKSNLITCLQLEPNIEQIRIKLYQIFAQSNSPFNPVKDSGSYKNTCSLNNELRQNLVQDVNTQKPFHFNEPGSIKLNEINFDKMKEIQSPQQQSTLMFDLSKYIVINSQLVKPAELECSLCMRLLYNPVTTPCGHTFCAVCLERSLDHQDRCPLCKNSLADYLAERRQFTTSFLDKLIRTHYGNDYAERKKQHHEELRELLGDENEIPVFVCTLALPFAPCPLHIYEPRYRLMLRRAIETGRKQFGMCMYSERTPYHYTEYGCMLEIQTYQFTRDGRSIVTTVGGRRFRVLKSGTKDGYNVAKVEWVKDVRVEDEHEKSELLQLHDEVYRLAQAWYSIIPETQKNRITEIYGIGELPLPEADIQTENGPYWHWFLLNILPLETDFQYKFLTKTSLKERLKQMKKIIFVLTAPLKNMLVAQLHAAAATSNANASSSSTNEQQQQQQTSNSASTAANRAVAGDSSSLNSSDSHATPSDVLSSASSNEISVNNDDNTTTTTTTTATSASTSRINLNNNPYI